MGDEALLLDPECRAVNPRGRVVCTSVGCDVLEQRRNVVSSQHVRVGLRRRQENILAVFRAHPRCCHGGTLHDCADHVDVGRGDVLCDDAWTIEGKGASWCERKRVGHELEYNLAGNLIDC
jgi:hypothetical protein